MSESLSPGQQVFNQRLMAAHCLSEQETVALFKSLQEHHECLQDTRLSDVIASCNAQLQYLGLEIVAVSMPSDEEGGSNKNVRHYAMVNKFPDEISKKAFQSHLFQPPQQQTYVKAVLQKLVDDAAEEEKTARATLLNLNREADLNLTQAEDCLERLIEEKWLAATGRTNQAAVRLGARTYCELSYLLTDEFGMEAGALPQQIILR